LVTDLGDRVDPVKFLVHDRDSRLTVAFHAVFAAEGIRILRTPPQAPRANAICERMIGTRRRELLDRILIVNQRHLRRILTAYMSHCNTTRPHRSQKQLTPPHAETRPPEPIDSAGQQVRRRPVLGRTTSKYLYAA
jgi:transposase InsO family protein